MIKFDLERALRGDELITRGGGLVTGFVSRGYGLSKCYPYIADNLGTYTNKGSYYGTSKDSKDLFMKYEDKKTRKTFTTFTKSDLKTGMFVKYRNGEYKMVLGDNFTGYLVFNPFFYYEDNLLASNRQDSELDIVSVYESGAKVSMNAYFKGKYLSRIWERTQQTEAQKEMASLNKKIAELQLQATRLQGKI